MRFWLSHVDHFPSNCTRHGGLQKYACPRLPQFIYPSEQPAPLLETIFATFD